MKLLFSEFFIRPCSGPNRCCGGRATSTPSGFTLPELLIALAILTLLITLAIPSFSSLIKQQQAKTALQQLTHLIAFAREQAIERGEPITLCHSSDQKTCSGRWSDGQIVLTPHNQLLRAASIVPKGGLLTMIGFLSNEALTFTAFGESAAQSARFTFIPKGWTLPTTFAVIVSRVGRVRVEP